MKNTLKNPLFSGISEKDKDKILTYLNITPVDYSKGENILNYGQKVSHMGIVLKGRVHVKKEDSTGQLIATELM